MYDAINDSRTRPAHLAMDNYIAPVNDPIWKTWTPPVGFSCRCALVSLTESQARARGYPRPFPDGARPDPGWDYDKLADVDEGLRRAADAAVRSTLGPLGDAAQSALVVPPGAMGPAVSNALLFTSGTRELGASVSTIIDSIHGDGTLPSIPVRSARMKDAAGKYRTRGGAAVDIKIDPRRSRKALTLAHEVGHLLDHNSIGRPRTYESERANGVLAGVMEKIESTIEVSRLRQALQSEQAIGRSRRSFSRRHQWLEYAVSSKELWARAYAQYIAVKSSDAELLKGVSDISASKDVDYALSQWSTESFAPIIEAIDEAFKRIGWIR
jgi:hypothetical protein